MSKVIICMQSGYRAAQAEKDLRSIGLDGFNVAEQQWDDLVGKEHPDQIVALAHLIQSADKLYDIASLTEGNSEHGVIRNEVKWYMGDKYVPVKSFADIVENEGYPKK